MKTTFLVAVFAFALAGCASTPPGQITGDYVHAPSGFRFPEQIASFKRASLVPHDAAGRSVTAGYAGGSARCLTAITFWIDPIESPPAADQARELLQMAEGKLLDPAFSSATREVLDAHPAAILESMESGLLDEMPARRAIYRIDYRRLEIVVLIARHAWYLKYRVMFPADCAAEASPPVTEFFEAWRR